MLLGMAAGASLAPFIPLAPTPRSVQAALKIVVPMLP